MLHLFRLERGRGLAALGVVAGALALSSACATPRVVTDITGSEGEIKLVYATRMGNTGIVSCERAEDGALTACRDVEIDFKKKGE